VDSAPKSFVIADGEAISLAEGSIWATAMRGGQEPPESLARGTLPRGFSRNLGTPLSLLLHKAGMVRLTAKDQASDGMDAPAEGANKRPAEEVAGGRGKPETASEGLAGVLRPHSTGEGGELAQAGTHWREGGNKRTHRMQETWRYSEIEGPCQRNTFE
jgi:hypothetical protein